MIKRESLQTGSRYSNALGEKSFVGSRIEGGQRVTTMTFEIPYEDAITGIVYYVKDTRKISVPVEALPADFSASQEKANAYQEQELPPAPGGVLNRASFAAGAIEWSIADIA